MFQRIIAVAFFATTGLSTLTSQEPGKEVTSSKLDLTRQTLAGLHALVRPHNNEWRHLRVDWLTDVVAARKKAVAEDKPIVICYTGGAGYNEPLGVC
ncbi:MAG: hypothetical protein HYX68_05270 [Planctomycetes bacterium]|nr:hypothetical protein [Planctomycetota bacterium]